MAISKDTTSSPLPTLALKPAAAQSLEHWHAMVARLDFSELGQIVHPEALMHSPSSLEAFRRAESVTVVLATAIQVFDDFAYHREFVSADGLEVVLEFSARVGDQKVKGVDVIRFDAQGQIVDFEVMVRPLAGARALVAEMGNRLGAGRVQAFKAGGPGAG